MSDRFGRSTFLPRMDAASAAHALAPLYRRPLDELVENPFDLRQAAFHPHGEERATEDMLRSLRDELNAWAYGQGFPSPPSADQKSTWDVGLGVQLLRHLEAVPELHHPDVWCWMASVLLPHLVIYRWDWPKEQDGQAPRTRTAWDRFGASGKNGLLLALNRIVIFGPELAERATEQEFQSLQYRPAFGSDRRVARLVMEVLISAVDDPASQYGKNGGSRSLDNNHVCLELRYVNSLRPLCFLEDSAIRELVTEVVGRLPQLRERDVASRS